MNNIKYDHRVIIRSEQKIAGTFNKEVEVSSSVKKTIIARRNSCFHGQRCENFTLLASADVQTLVFATFGIFRLHLLLTFINIY
jgi:abortive infection bacteriophage resistance protein